MLWQDFVSYRLPTRQAYEKKNYAEDENALDSNLSDLSLDSSHALTQIMYGRLAEEAQQQRGAYSMYDVEKLMEFQASELQRLGGRLPDGMKTVLHQISRAGTTIPKMAHYLNFLDSWRAGDFHSAYDNIHRYFDFAMQTQDRSFYQYALLNLAILQADAGCPAEALPAMQEAIAAARENKDTTCLNFCMSWVYHFARSFPGKMDAIRESGILGSEVEGLAFLKARARDAEMWTLLSTTYLGEAKLGLQYGDSIAGVLENIAKASHLNIVRSTQRLSGAALLMKGPVFGRVGLNHVGWWYSQIFMQCHAKEASLEDVMKCTCRLAALLVQRGRYDEAQEMLNNVPPSMLRVVKFQNYISLYGGLLRVRRMLHRGNFDGAERLLGLLRGRGSPDVELRFSLSMFEVELMLRRGLLDEALQKVEKVGRAAVENQEINDITLQMRLLNLKTRVLIQSGQSLKAFSLITRAVRTAYRARHLAAMWESIGLLATILNDLREFAAAVDLVESIMPRVLECDDCGLAARTYSVLADANMGLAGLETNESTRQKELLGRTVENLDRACSQFRHLEDVRGQLDMLKKKATIMHWEGDLVLANDTATQYLDLLKEYKGQTTWTE
jgi:anaphase-promoting complex subunit 5